MKKLSLAFFGTPYFAAEFLEKILADKDLPLEVRLVVTQPDRPVGRDQILSPTPVKKVANKYELPVFDTEFKEVRQQLISNKNENSTDGIKSLLKGLDIALIYAFGRIIPKELLDLPRFKMWNVHQSILPLYRNVSPISYPIFLGDKTTGTTLMLLNEKLDEGDIIAQKKLPISPVAKRSELEVQLTDLAFGVFKQTVMDIASSQSMPATKKQDHDHATYTRKLLKEDGFIPFGILLKCLSNGTLSTTEFPQIMQEYYEKYPSKQNLASSQLLYNYFRGMYPWPGIWTEVIINGQKKRLKINDMQFNGDKITLTKLQLEGKKEVDFKTFQTAYKLF